MPQSTLDENSFIFEKLEIKELKDKIKSNGELIKNLDIKINRGIRTGFNKAYIIDDEIKSDLLKQDSSAIEIIKPLIRGRDINKWQINFNNLYLLLIRDNKDIINNYPIIYDYLKQFEDSLKNRSQVVRGDHHWLELDNNTSDEYCSLFDKEKIIYAEITPEPRFIYDNEKYYSNDSIFIMNSDTINLNYLVTLLNSKLLFWYFKDIGYNFGGKGFMYKKQFVERIPICITEKDIELKLSDLSDKMINTNKELTDEINSFKKWLIRNYNIDKLSKKLETYYDLTFEDFLKEIQKKTKIP